ncbi:hypothetical protein R8Z50_13325 [Longispora sp. K20-0274]|uniref:hypothetical protein n=1 Tax=Longispora sp. K20-0274 TaxID=3088255 RepID=UPI00399BD6AC
MSAQTHSTARVELDEAGVTLTVQRDGETHTYPLHWDLDHPAPLAEATRDLRCCEGLAVDGGWEPDLERTCAWTAHVRAAEAA